MIALDTNVVVRFLVADDPRQAARARAVVERALSGGEQLFVADVVCSIRAALAASRGEHYEFPWSFKFFA